MPNNNPNNNPKLNSSKIYDFGSRKRNKFRKQQKKYNTKRSNNDLKIKEQNKEYFNSKNDKHYDYPNPMENIENDVKNNSLHNFSFQLFPPINENPKIIDIPPIFNNVNSLEKRGDDYPDIFNFLNKLTMKQNNPKPKPLKKKKEFKIDINKDYEIIDKKIETLDDLIELGKMYDPKSTNSYSIDLKKLNNLVDPLINLKNAVGMQRVKKSIVNHIMYLIQGFGNNDDMMHTVILGPPGVGKTMLGRILGDIYYNMDIISGNSKTTIDPITGEKKNYTFKIVKRSDLVGKYLGHTAPKVENMIKECEGGVMFIDEAYSLGNGNSDENKDSFSKEAIDIINQNLSENKNWQCIIAGYKDAIEKHFFSHNEGLKRRFHFVYEIDSYSASELTEIFIKKVESHPFKWTLDQNVINKLEKFIEENINTFNNFGGDIETLFMKCRIKHGSRVFNLHPKEKGIITMEDIKNAFDDFILSKYKRGHIDNNNNTKLNINIQTLDDIIEQGNNYDTIENDNKELRYLNRLSKYVKKLNDMIGIDDIKKNIVNHIKYLLSTHDDIPHFIIEGKSGQGKTYFAKLITNLYYVLKIIKGNHDVINKNTGKIEKFPFLKIQSHDITEKMIAQDDDIIDKCRHGVLLLKNINIDKISPKKQELLIEFMNIIRKIISNNDTLIILSGNSEHINKYFITESLKQNFIFKYHIPEYSMMNLEKIFLKLIKKYNLLLEKDVKFDNIFVENNFKNGISDLIKFVKACKFQNIKRTFGDNIGTINQNDILKGFEDYIFQNKDRSNEHLNHLYT